MFDSLIKLYSDFAPSIVVILLLVGGVMTTMKLLSKNGGGAKEAGLLAAKFLLAALVMLAFYKVAPSLVNSVSGTVGTSTGTTIDKVTPPQ